MRQKLRAPIYFASLQGETAKQLLDPQDRESLDSLIVLTEGQILKRSAAVFFILKQAGSWIRIFLIFSILPKKLTDLLYNFVAHYRYRIFGQRSSCRLPTEAEKQLLLP